jgi:hypothetical protein
MSPVIIPITVFSRFDLKNDPWPQSWNIMKVLTIKPAAIIASGSISQKETFSAKTIATHITIYMPSELMICHQLFALSGKLYLEMIFIHSGRRSSDVILLFITILYDQEYLKPPVPGY